MRIATKLNIVVLVAFAVGAWANYLVLQGTIKPRFDEIELAAAHRDHGRVIDAISSARESLRASAQDYAFWDNCYDFAQGKDDGFIASTLTPAPKMLEHVSVDAAVFLNLGRDVLWAAGKDESSQASSKGLVPDLLNLSYRHPYLSGSGQPVVLTGITSTSSGLALVAVAPIVKGDHSGAPMGVVIMAKLLDVPAFEDVTGVHFSIDRIVNGETLQSDKVIVKSSPNFLQTSSLMSDITGQPLAHLTANTPRDLTKVGAAAINSAMLLMMTVAGGVITALWLFVRRNVVSRIVGLKNHFAHAVEGDRIAESRSDTAADEIGDLSRSFNQMAAHVNNMRDAIADSAYLNGVSEWATGTLHNVRNALTPINIYALKIQDLFEDRLCGNLRQAIAEIDAPDTDPLRRDKLKAYVQGSAQALVAGAGQSQKLAERIVATSRTIEEIVSEYEKFGRRETRVTPVEIRELAESIAKMVLESGDTRVRFTISQEPATVRANRTILRQIISNLLVNALEAMQQTAERRITIDVKRSENAGFIDLAITDNGEGIPPENLRAIFERGFSTRRHKKGGLGLHWCANAAKAMGGSLRVHSEGPGTGATLVVSLQAQTADQSIGEAA